MIVVAAFRECGCLAAFRTIIEDGRFQPVEFDTVNWPAYGYETRIIDLPDLTWKDLEAGRYTPLCTHCDRCIDRPFETLTQRWKRFYDIHEEAMNAVRVMKRLSGG